MVATVLVIAERAQTKRATRSARCGSKSFLLAAVILASLSACSFGSVKNTPQPFVSGHATKSEGFTNFETEPVRPLALSAEGRFLYALNTADDRLEIFAARSP